MRRVLYTVIVGSYDRLAAAPELPGVDCVCFTDETAREARGWRLRPLPIRFDDPVRTSRLPKILPHRYLPEYDESLYADGHTRFRPGVERAFDYLRHHDWAAPAHPLRDCVYDERQACLARGVGEPERMHAQVERYRAAGMPAHAGLVENGLTLRRHGKREIAAFGEAWWAEYAAGCCRDQIAWPFVAWTRGLAYRALTREEYDRHFFLEAHRA